MGLRGPALEPTALKKRRGYYRPSRHGDEVLEAKVLDFVHKEFPLAPDSLDSYAKDIWVSTLSQASKLYGYISFIDLKLFEQYCEVYSELMILNEKCKSTEMYYMDKHGKIVVHPIFRERKEKRKMFIKITAEFGFSPSSRTRIALKSDPSEEKKVVDYTL